MSKSKEPVYDKNGQPMNRKAIKIYMKKNFSRADRLEMKKQMKKERSARG